MSFSTSRPLLLALFACSFHLALYSFSVNQPTGLLKENLFIESDSDFSEIDLVEEGSEKTVPTQDELDDLEDAEIVDCPEVEVDDNDDDEMPSKQSIVYKTDNVQAKIQIKFKPESFFAKNINLFNSKCFC